MLKQQPHRVHELITSLKQQRDELSVQMHLAGMEARDEWDRLDQKLAELCSRYEPLKDAVDESAGDVWDSMKLMGTEIGDGFKRVANALCESRK